MEYNKFMQDSSEPKSDLNGNEQIRNEIAHLRHEIDEVGKLTEKYTEYQSRPLGIDMQNITPRLSRWRFQEHPDEWNVEYDTRVNGREASVVVGDSYAGYYTEERIVRVKILYTDDNDEAVAENILPTKHTEFIFMPDGSIKKELEDEKTEEVVTAPLEVGDLELIGHLISSVKSAVVLADNNV